MDIGHSCSPIEVLLKEIDKIGVPHRRLARHRCDSESFSKKSTWQYLTASNLAIIHGILGGHARLLVALIHTFYRFVGRY